jgi:hypothetical protein
VGLPVSAGTRHSRWTRRPRLVPRRNIDLADPARPVLGEPLISFSGVGVPAGRDGLHVVARVTGVWTSTDAGVTWRQSRRDLEEVTLSVDPLRAPFPEAEQQRGSCLLSCGTGFVVQSSSVHSSGRLP